MRLFKQTSINLLAAWLVFLALMPFLLVLVFSFLKPANEAMVHYSLTLHNYSQLFHPIYFHIFIRSFYLAAITAMICLVLGYPFAFILAKINERIRPVLIFLLILPFWTSSLIRIYSIIIIIRNNGLLNRILEYLGIIHSPIHLLYTQSAVLIGLVYALLPFMILPLFSNLEKFDWRIIDAARDLGASKLRIFFKVIMPITMPGIIAGVMLVLLPAMTMFYIPDILGGAKSLLLGNLIKQQFIEAQNWPLGSAVSILLTVFMGILLLIYFMKTTGKERRELM